VQRIQKVVPDYMVMGERGMADMGEMEMALPDNTAPMMTGTGPFGPIEMGGMFTMMKVRREQKPGDYSDPGWYRQPPGTQAFEYGGPLPEPARFESEKRSGGAPVPGLNNPPSPAAATQATKAQPAPLQPATATVRKPGPHAPGHH
jgi:hypothetical protein